MFLKFTPSSAKHLQNTSLETHVDITPVQMPLNLIREVQQQQEEEEEASDLRLMRKTVSTVAGK